MYQGRILEQLWSISNISRHQQKNSIGSSIFFCGTQMVRFSNLITSIGYQGKYSVSKDIVITIYSQKL